MMRILSLREAPVHAAGFAGGLEPTNRRLLQWEPMSDRPQRRYFDNAATSFPKPPAVGAAMMRFLCDNGAPGRGAYSEARAAARLIRRCRERIARLVNLSSP